MKEYHGNRIHLSLKLTKCFKHHFTNYVNVLSGYNECNEYGTTSLWHESFINFILVHPEQNNLQLPSK